MKTILALVLPAGHFGATLAATSPNRAALALALGLLLIFAEFNRPGRVLPGALGLALCLLATAALWDRPLRPGALALSLLALATVALGLWLPLPFWLSGCAVAALVVGVRLLVQAGPRITLPVALTCGLGIGLPGTALSRIALRARRLKAVH